MPFKGTDERTIIGNTNALSQNGLMQHFAMNAQMIPKEAVRYNVIF